LPIGKALLRRPILFWIVVIGRLGLLHPKQDEGITVSPEQDLFVEFRETLAPIGAQPKFCLRLHNVRRLSKDFLRAMIDLMREEWGHLRRGLKMKTSLDFGRRVATRRL
jgi:hypothetical protein